VITSTSNEKVKLAQALQTRARARRKEGKIALEGVRLVRDALQAGQHPEFVLMTPDLRDGGLLALLKEQWVEPLPVSDEVMRSVSETEQPQGVLAVFPMPQPNLPAKLARALILDAVRDPGNLGTMLRTAAAAGVEAVLLSPDSADPYNPKALRGGMGAHFRVPVVELEWSAIASACAGMNVYLADGGGDLRYDAADWSRPWTVIVGGEAHGAGEEAHAMATARISIPMAAATESLNAAVAAGVILFEAAKSR
jgi:TrmH family RNA methyltransferase